MKRTHRCGDLTIQDVDKEVRLSGWVHRRRDHGGLIFIDIRDREGITQLVMNPGTSSQAHTIAQKLGPEDVISAAGKVAERPKGTENPKIKTGAIEILLHQLEILNKSQTPPFEIEDETEINEELRLKYRYLDLRRPKMQKNLRLRHELFQVIREVLDQQGFWEVETPILTKSTPEGARDYLVPSRLNPGEFFALPQSPQLFKQILMISGIDRYFQLARCFRDEDLRKDRQPEFTQLDMELAFTDEEEIFTVVEQIVQAVFQRLIGVSLKLPFTLLSYQRAMTRYGSDKPDLRFGMEINDVSSLFQESSFKVFQECLKAGGSIQGISVSGAGNFSRSEIDQWTQKVQEWGAKGLAYFKVGESLESPIAKFFEPAALVKLKEKFTAKPGEMIFLVADELKKGQTVLGQLRLALAQGLKQIPEGEFSCLWVTDFPLFGWNEEEKRWDAEHHPFTAPHPEDIGLLEKDPGQVRSRAYDLVINGSELASGSIRIHQPDLQSVIFKTIGLSREEAERRFGFLLKAFSYGAPPHGGIALGLDRLLVILAGLSSIREVIAFPKTQKALCLLSGAPSEVSERQLKELGIKVKGGSHEY